MIEQEIEVVILAADFQMVEFREPLINGLDKNYTKITDDLVAPTERNSTLWWIAILLTGAGAAFFVFCLGWTVWFGIGTWGLNKTVGWAWDSRFTLFRRKIGTAPRSKSPC